MTRGLRVATALVVLFTCTFAASPASAAKKRGCSGASATPKPSTVAQANGTILCLINAQRAARRTSKLRPSALLSSAALGHSTDMVASQFFAHDSLDGQTPRQRAARAGYAAAGSVEEALAVGWAQLSTPRSLVAALMRSASHRSILLDRRLRYIGLGLVLGAPQPGAAGGATLTLDLARR